MIPNNRSILSQLLRIYVGWFEVCGEFSLSNPTEIGLYKCMHIKISDVTKYTSMFWRT